MAFRSHWGYEAEFCTPVRGNEKGGVEGEGGFFRRNHLTPVPVARDYAHLNELLREASAEDERRVVGERTVSVGTGMALEREYLLPLAKEGFDLAAVKFPVMNPSGCIRVLMNWHSAPLAAGTEVEAKIHATYDRCCKGLKQRQGKQAGTRAMIEILLEGQKHSVERLRQAIERALELGCSDKAAVEYLLTDGKGREEETGGHRTGCAACPRETSADHGGLRPTPAEHARGGDSMSADTSKLQAAAIRELCKPLHLPTVATQAMRLAEQAAKEKQSPLSFWKRCYPPKWKNASKTPWRGASKKRISRRRRRWTSSTFRKRNVVYMVRPA